MKEAEWELGRWSDARTNSHIFPQLERIRVDSTIHRLPAHCTFSPLKPQHTDTRHSCLLTRIRGALHYKPLKEMPRWKLSKR